MYLACPLWTRHQHKDGDTQALSQGPGAEGEGGVREYRLALAMPQSKRVQKAQVLRAAGKQRKQLSNFSPSLKRPGLSSPGIFVR